MRDYHDREWGRPVHDDQRLFEMLCLEGAQAGLSWDTILRRREGYRSAYEGFDAAAMATWDEARQAALLADARIIRNPRQGRRVPGQRPCHPGRSRRAREPRRLPVALRGRAAHRQPPVAAGADPGREHGIVALSKDLRARGFRFVGPVIVYAFMQSVGMVDDHIADCFVRP